MPFLSDFLCPKCGHINKDIMFNSFEHYDNKKHDVFCMKCSNKMRTIFLKAPAIYVKENCEPVSVKPSSYWRNAEHVKQKSMKKKKDQQKEKEYYNDGEVVQKRENLRRNMENNK